MTPKPILQAPCIRDGVLEFPVHHMRGGTSTGLVIWSEYAPAGEDMREELLRHLMGVPLSGTIKGNRQITGLGRGTATSNKVFFVEGDAGGLTSTLAQLASDHAGIDWSVNCGNMSSAILPWAIDMGLVKARADGDTEVVITNTNTGVLTTSRISKVAGKYLSAEIPGVVGRYPSVDLFLHDPVGSKTGKLLPTGSASNVIRGHAVSCIDVAVPMVIADAASFGKTAHESIEELAADAAFMAELRGVWVEAGLAMGLKRRDGTPMTEDDLRVSETIPKVCIVGKPHTAGNIAVRYFTPQTGHNSMAVSGGCCLAAAALVPGTVAHDVAIGLLPVTSPSETLVGIENPAGLLEASVAAEMVGGELHISKAAYRRSAQILLRGSVPLYNASPQLCEAILSLTHG